MIEKIDVHQMQPCTLISSILARIYKRGLTTTSRGIIASEFKKGHKAVIMENHVTVVGGSDILDVYQRFETLELTARPFSTEKQLDR